MDSTKHTRYEWIEFPKLPNPYAYATKQEREAAKKEYYEKNAIAEEKARAQFGDEWPEMTWLTGMTRE